MATNLNRRDLFKLAGLGAAAAVLPACAIDKREASPAVAAAGPTTRKLALRVAHVTDTHVQPELASAQGLSTCLAHIQAQPTKPSLIITGGDHVMDSFDAGDARTAIQWDLFKKTWRDNCNIETVNVIGNHDCWGWNKDRSKTSGAELNWGKARFLAEIGSPALYRTVDRAGWRFILLDSIFPNGNGYVGQLDEAQFAWLSQTLAETPSTTPIVVVSHIPIVTATAMFDGKDETKRDRIIPPGLMHADAKRIVNLFRKHKNVRLCMSGHMHLNDRIDLHGVSYVCAGAVSGKWWKGANDDCVEGYTLLDLYDDGMFEYAYVNYGWKAQA